MIPTPESQEGFRPTAKEPICVRLATGRLLASVMLSLVFFVGGGLWLLSHADVLPDPMVRLAGYVSVATGVAFVLLGLWRLLWGERFEICDDRIRIVDRFEDVAGEIPFEAIVRVGGAQTRGHGWVGIRVVDPKTIRWPLYLRVGWLSGSYHFSTPGGLAETAATLSDWIRERLEEWRRARG
jgi:hypothetical protein